MERKKGKIITVTSSKGGVGKTIFITNLAGIMASKNQKVLLIDCDFIGGAIALNLDLNPSKNIFHISDDLLNNRYQGYENYLTHYHKNIDVIATCKDPRQALKIDTNMISGFLNQVKNYYDFVLVDTTHGLTKENIILLDRTDIILYMMTNDLMDMKNSKAFMGIINEIEINSIKVVLNNSRDTGLNYFSKYDIRSMIGRNIDYCLDQSLYIKNITSFLIEGEIFTLNKSLTFKDKNDLRKLEKMAEDFIEM